MRRLPPLNALRAFEASARLGSFVSAAAELRVSPAAVSQQVRRLEEYLDTRLFERPLVAQLGHPVVKTFLESLAVEDCFTAEQVAKLSVPTLVIWGKSDRILPRSGLDVYKRELPPGTKFEEPEGLGHSPHLERPRWLLERIISFAGV